MRALVVRQGGRMPEEIRPDAVYTVSECASLLRMRRESVRRLAESGELRSFVPNGCERGRRVRGQWLLDWIEGASRHG